MNRIACVLTSLLLGSAVSTAGERAQILVAADGSGMFRTIQDALNSIPNSTD